MPNPNFQMIVGGGSNPFAEIAAQQQNWAGFNRGVEEGNIARAAQAQQVQNNWLAQAAALRDAADQRNLNLQLNADEQARRSAETAIDRAIQQKQFTASLASQGVATKERLAAEDRRTAAMTAQDQTRFAAQLKRQEDSIASSAEDYASNYGLLVSEAKDADKEFALATQELTAAQAKKAIDPLKVTPAEIKNLETQQRVAERAAKSAASKLFFERRKIEGKGFQINDSEGHILHPTLGRKWSFREAVADARSRPDPLGTTEYQPGQSWAGFGGDSGSATGTMPAPSSSPTKVWKRVDGKLVLVQ